jgi:hypothetical protein
VTRTRKGSKGPGYEYWGRRSHLSGQRCPGPDTKRATHRAERRDDKKKEREE